jgi:hypothetical protein
MKINTNKTLEHVKSFRLSLKVLNYANILIIIAMEIIGANSSTILVRLYSSKLNPKLCEKGYPFNKRNVFGFCSFL